MKALNIKKYLLIGMILGLGWNFNLYAQTITSVSLQGAKPTGTNTWDVDYINGANSIIEKEVSIGYSNHTNNGNGNGKDYFYYTQSGTSLCWEVLQGGSGSNSWKTLPFCESANGGLNNDPTQGTHITYFRYNSGKTGCATTGTFTETLSIGWSTVSGSSCSGFKTGTTPLELEVTVQVVTDNLYTWSEPTSGTDSSYKIAGNWTPTRTSPSTDDILVVDLAQGSNRNTTIYMDGVSDQINQFKIFPNNYVTFKCSTSTNTGNWTTGNVTSSDGDDFVLDSLAGMRFDAGTLNLNIPSGNTAMFKSDLNVAGGTLNINGPGSITHRKNINTTGGALNYKSSATTTLNLAGKDTKLSGTGGSLYIDSTVNVVIGNGATSSYTLERILPIISNLSLKSGTTLYSNAPTSYTSVSAINAWTPFLQLKATPKPNSTAHGQIVEILGNATIDGGAQFEIYNNKQRAYRAFGIPLKNGTLIPQFTDDIVVTGTVTGSNANDFTTTCSYCTHSMFQWNESTSSWTPYASGNDLTNIPLGTGILTFFRGAIGNGLGDTSASANEQIIDFKGELTVGRPSIVLNNGGTGALKGYNLIGNPYPSAIDLRLVYESNKSKILPRFYFYDAIARRYNEWDSVTSNGNSTTPKKNGTTKFQNPGNSVKKEARILDAGGAVFVVVSSNNATETITFNESHKERSLRSATKHFSSGVQEENTVPCNELKGMLQYQKTDSFPENDGFTLEFDIEDGNPKGDIMDMNKLYAGYLGLGTLTSNDYWLSIDRRNKIAEIGETKSIPLKVAYPKESPAAVELVFQTCDETNKSYDIQLFDKLTQKAHPVNNGSVYPFTAQTAEEKKPDRFELLFTGIEKQNNISSQHVNPIAVFPNPSENGVFYVLNKEQNTKTAYEVFELNGQVITKGTLESSNQVNTINLSDAPKGIYIIKFTSNNQTSTQKVQLY